VFLVIVASAVALVVVVDVLDLAAAVHLVVLLGSELQQWYCCWLSWFCWLWPWWL
jgi:hypothetical protein